MSEMRSTRQRKRQRRLGARRTRMGMSKIALAAIASAFAMTNAGCGSAPPTSETLRSTPVTVADVQEYSGGEGVNYSASIVPYTQLPLSFKSGGYVTSILQRPGPDGKPRNLQQGDYVKKDAVVATVRQADYQHSVEQYKGQLEQAQAGQLKAQQDFARADALYKANALTQTDYDSSKAQLDSTQGTVATAQAAVAQAQQALADCELRAPMDGQILARNVEVGTLAGAGTQAFTMGDIEFVKAVFGIPDTLLSSVQLKQRQGVRTETYAQEFFGQVSAISPQADPKSRTFQVEVTIPNSKGLLKSGMVATLDIGSSRLRTPALVVPIEAVVSPADGSKTFSVFVVTHQGDKDTVHRRTVQPGPALGNMVSIVEGVSRGEKIVSNGATLVTDGQVIHVIP
jgi:RND family efflux transporter MFP subunit